MITSENYKQKLKRLEWLCEMEANHGADCYNDEISDLSDELEHYEALNFPIEPPSPVPLIEFHMDRLGWNKSKMAKAIGISDVTLSKLINRKINLSLNMEIRLNKIDYNKFKN